LTCLTREELAAWVLGDAEASDGERLEEHLFACDACGERAETMEALVRQLRTTVPAWLTRERRVALEKALPLRESSVAPGKEATLELGRDAPIGFWIMQADLTGVERLDCAFLSRDGALLTSFEDVPFDADRGEVVLACQIHYRHLPFPHDMVVRVEAIEPSGRRPIGDYLLHHVYSGD
jgi:hypothetical protein